MAVAWLGVVPLTACRIYRTLFTGSVSTILSLPINVFSTENILTDILQGCAVVSLTLLAFIGLVWLREQILHGGGPAWLEPEEVRAAFQGENIAEDLPADAAVVAAPGPAGDGGDGASPVDGEVTLGGDGENGVQWSFGPGL